eukprot:1703316-Lingulodinium_polyedra.AAC.1
MFPCVLTSCPRPPGVARGKPMTDVAGILLRLRTGRLLVRGQYSCRCAGRCASGGGSHLHGPRGPLGV